MQRNRYGISQKSCEYIYFFVLTVDYILFRWTAHSVLAMWVLHINDGSVEASVTADKPAKIILVVEDEPDMSIFLSNLLTANDFCPICAVTLAEGLKKAIDACPDLIIINAMLPGEAGIRLYRCLRTSDRLCHIPVVMLSTLDSSTFYRFPGTKRSPTGRHLPEPEAYLQKPPEADELLSVINRLCATRSTDLGDSQ